MIKKYLTEKQRQAIMDYKAERFPSLSEAEAYINNLDLQDPIAVKNALKKLIRWCYKAFKALKIDR